MNHPGGGDQPRDADAEEMADLMERHLPALRRFLAKRAREWVLVRESAGDLAQSACRDVLTQLDEGRFELRSEAEFKQWLYEAGLLKLKARARFHQADKRDVGREVGRIDPAASEAAGFEPASSTTPSRVLALEETRSRVRKAIEDLGGRDAEVLRAVVLEGRSHADVAKSLDVDVAHCRVLLSRAMAKLSGRLKEGG